MLLNDMSFDSRPMSALEIAVHIIANKTLRIISVSLNY
jgi:hypothetical protein